MSEGDCNFFFSLRVTCHLARGGKVGWSTMPVRA